MHTAFPLLEQELARQIREASLDHEAFETLLAPCDLGRCRGMCCHDGVYLGEEERVVIAEVAGREDLSEHREGRLKTRTVAAREEQLGEGFPAHFPHTRCALLDDQHHCLLQKKALAVGRHPWFWKPFPCWLHPLTIIRDPGDRQRPRLTLPTAAQEPARKEGYPGFASQTSCGRAAAGGVPAWQALRAELAFLSQISGRNLVRELGGE